MEHFRVIIEKKPYFNIEGQKLAKECIEYLKIESIRGIIVLNVYDLVNANADQSDEIIQKVLFDPSMDILHKDKVELKEGEMAFRMEYHKGGYDQRQHSTEILIKDFLGFSDVKVKTSKLIKVTGVSNSELLKIKSYYINPIEAKEISISEFYYEEESENTTRIPSIEGFSIMNLNELQSLKNTFDVAMDIDDLQHCQEYFKIKERNPKLAELKMLDTYWSDHCRHTTFMTELTELAVEEGKYKNLFEESIKDYFQSREAVHGGRKAVSLMDLATINMKEISKKGLLDDKEISDEINAASIEIDVDVDGKDERWLLMFKNETHNHPTEIEPFGGASTCLGGGIRDPLSGRSYVYQAMRITGAADPRGSYEETRKGKLPQRKITRIAMDGYSSYGYQIGGTSGFIREIYHPGFMAKRMELGALVSAVPKKWVQRGKPEATDLILLIGGETGRDGLGAAVGSSVEQKSDALATAGAEVQKGNPPLERKIVRLFRNPAATKMIKKCNDFGAGGVAVAVGELAEGLFIDLDKVPVKYLGMDGTEIALSESQERMAIVIASKDLDEFRKLAYSEDLEVAVIASVTDDKKVQMVWHGDTIIDIDREFIETSGVRKRSKISMTNPSGESYIYTEPARIRGKQGKEAFIANMTDLNTCSQKGLVDRFDNTIGSGTVFMQLGGKTQLTPQEGMVAKLPVQNGETKSCSIMTYGYDPELSTWSTYHGGYYAVIESISKIVAMGGDFNKIRLSFQEFYERLGQDPQKWAKPFSSLLGAFKVQKALDIPSIGGKDSMSGSFEDINVPPSLLSFAVAVDKVDNMVSREFKSSGSPVVVIKLSRDENSLMNMEEVKKSYSLIKSLIDKGMVLSSSTVKFGGAARAVGEMTLGNKIGFMFKNTDDMYLPLFGNIILEIKKEALEEFKNIKHILLGYTMAVEEIILGEEKLSLEELSWAWTAVLESVFPVKEDINPVNQEMIYNKGPKVQNSIKISRPKVLIPIFTGTHGEYDMKASFEKAGAVVETFVFNSRSITDIEESYKIMAEKISQSQILGLAHGFLLGNEPEAAGKLLNIVMRHELVQDAVMKLLKENDGLVLGVGTGFNSLIKLGLIEYGEFAPVSAYSSGIGYNKNMEFVSTMVDVKVVSKLSPWFGEMKVGDIYTVPVATKEGRIFLGKNGQSLISRGQISTQYMRNGRPTGDGLSNPTGSQLSIESMTSPDGRVLGCVSSVDRGGRDIYKNIEIKGEEKIFISGVKYFD